MFSNDFLEKITRFIMTHKKHILFLLLSVITISISSNALAFPAFKWGSPDVAIDLGTQNTLIALCENEETKIMANFPSFIAFRRDTLEVMCVGEEAKEMYGKTPPYILALRPMQDGVIKDFEGAGIMLHHVFKQAKEYSRGLFRGPRMIVGVPCSVTDPEERAIREAAFQNGAREVHVVMEPMAAAIGADLPIEQARGSMVVDIGGGTTDIVVISLKAPVVSRAIRMAGDAMDRAIVKYIHDNFSLNIGEQTAEKIKKEIGAAWLPEGTKGKSMEVSGSDIVKGEPRTITMTTLDIIKATNECIEKIINEIRAALNDTPVELASDIARDGILLVGGSALLEGMAKRIALSIGAGKDTIKITVPKNPMLAVVDGLGKIAANFEHYRESLFSKTMGSR